MTTAGADGAPLRVVVVDDQALVRAGFALILRSAGLDVVAEAEDGLAAVAAVERHRPDVVLMDIRMPGLDGIEATRRLSRSTPQTRVVVLTTFDLDEHVYAAVRAGASGFLLKDVHPDVLVHSVRTAARGEAMVAPAVARRLLERFAAEDQQAPRPEVWQPLTDREREVAALVARGLSNHDIAARLFLSEATVKTYVSRLLTKLSLRDRVQVAALAYETGLVRPGRP
ncbi:response regulator transcription factor [Nocardioides sp. HDW12B]|uniref:response regulator n=1 Tax=Nocardioides sp. HDW12B TaxID=2714939 RepID=UPI0014074BA3|nr:response regulator transcription factor [Nocardioides sp. HDW12B]QIK65769.1 response regulator transcription factor [Nocardioides sp. HDW12B]